jgi:hypothetical protein
MIVKIPSFDLVNFEPESPKCVDKRLNITELRGFLENFLNLSQINIVSIHPVCGDVRGKIFSSLNLEEIIEYVIKENITNGRNVYFATNIRNSEGDQSKPPKLEDICELRMLGLDFDCDSKKPWLVERERLRGEVVDALKNDEKLAPHLIINSGGGVWGFWRAETDKEDIVDVNNALTRGLKHRFKKHQPDKAVGKINQIARLPYTISYPRIAAKYIPQLALDLLNGTVEEKQRTLKLIPQLSAEDFIRKGRSKSSYENFTRKLQAIVLSHAKNKADQGYAMEKFYESLAGQEIEENHPLLKNMQCLRPVGSSSVLWENLQRPKIKDLKTDKDTADWVDEAANILEQKASKEWLERNKNKKYDILPADISHPDDKQHKKLFTKLERRKKKSKKFADVLDGKPLPEGSDQSGSGYRFRLALYLNIYKYSFQEYVWTCLSTPACNTAKKANWAYKFSYDWQKAKDYIESNPRKKVFQKASETDEIVDIPEITFELPTYWLSREYKFHNSIAYFRKQYKWLDDLMTEGYLPKHMDKEDPFEYVDYLIYMLKSKKRTPQYVVWVCVMAEQYCKTSENREFWLQVFMKKWFNLSYLPEVKIKESLPKPHKKDIIFDAETGEIFDSEPTKSGNLEDENDEKSDSEDVQNTEEIIDPVSHPIELKLNPRCSAIMMNNISTQDLFAGKILNENQYQPLVSGLMHRGTVSLMAGLSQGGKTAAAVKMVVDLATGGDVFGRKVFKKCNILYVAGENKHNVTRRIAAQLINEGHAVSPYPNIVVTDNCDLLDFEESSTNRLDWETFAKRLQYVEISPDVVVIDHMFYATGGRDLTQTETIHHFYENLKEFGKMFERQPHFIVLIHETKPPSERMKDRPQSHDVYKISGSSAIPNLAENVFLCKDNGNGTNNLTFAKVKIGTKPVYDVTLTPQTHEFYRFDDSIFENESALWCFAHPNYEGREDRIPEAELQFLREKYGHCYSPYASLKTLEIAEFDDAEMIDLETHKVFPEPNVLHEHIIVCAEMNGGFMLIEDLLSGNTNVPAKLVMKAISDLCKQGSGRVKNSVFYLKNTPI